MLVNKIWFLMSEMNRGLGYHIYHRTCLPLKKTKRVGQMDNFRIQLGAYYLQIIKFLKGDSPKNKKLSSFT